MNHPNYKQPASKDEWIMNRLSRSFKTFMRCGTMAAALLISAFATGQDAATDDAQFQKLVQQVRTGQATSADILDLTRLAVENGKPFTANQALKGYLRRQMAPDPQVLLKAADIAALAGDLRMAVNRYKMYLRVAPPSEESSEAAARAYSLMIDSLGSNQDAYQFMLEMGGRHRKSVAARKFDRWYVHQAIRRRAYNQAATYLTTVLADAKPAAKNEWSGTAALLTQSMLDSAGENPDVVFEAVAALQGVVKNMGSLAGTDKYCELGAAYLDFLRQAHEDDAADLQELFAPVQKAATTWLDKDPTPATAEWILRIFAGRNPDKNVLKQHLALKRPVLQHAFAKLDGQRDWLLDHEIMGEFITWEDHVRNYPELSERIGWDTAGDRLAAMARDELAQYGKALKGVDSPEDKILSAIIGQKDPMAAARAIWRHTGSEGSATPLLSRYLPTIMATWYGDTFDGGAYHSALWQEMIVPFMAGANYRRLAEEQAVNLFEAHWRDADKLATLYHQADWIPWGDGSRRAVFAGVGSRVQSKQRELRQQIKSLQDGDGELEDEARKARIAELNKLADEALPAVSAVLNTVGNAEKVAALVFENREAKTPNAACLAMTKVYDLQSKMSQTNDKAKSQQLQKQREAAALEAYNALLKVKGHTADALRWSTIRRLADYANQGGRIKILEGELKREREGATAMASAVLWVQHQQRHNWPGDLRDDWERRLAEDYNRLLREHIAWQIKNEKPLDDTYVNWMVHTKRGRNWLDTDWAQDVMASIVDQRLLYKYDIKVFPEDTTATNYVRLIKDYFPGLGEKYPHRTHFAKWYVDESQKTGHLLDQGYWRHEGQDEGGVITSWVTKQWESGRSPVEDRGDWESHLFNRGDRPTVMAYLKKNTLDRELAGWSRIAGYNADPVAENQETRDALFKDLQEYVDFTQAQPFRYTMPSLFALRELDSSKYTDNEIDTLYDATSSFLAINGDWTGGWRYAHHRFLVHPLHHGLISRGRDTDLLQVMPAFWEIALESRHRQKEWLQTLGNWTRQLAADEKYNLAASYATAGLEIVGPRLPAEIREQVTLARSRSFTHVGGIPVPPNDPRYAIFEAQLAYQASNMDKAWKTYKENRSLLTNTYKDLDLDFLVWVIRRHTEFSEFEEAEGLAQTLIRFVDSEEAHFDPTQRGELFLAYANIALARQEFPRARAQYERIAATPEFRDKRVGQQAEIRIAEIDRITNRYAEAIERLQRLAETQDPYLRVNSLYQLARIKFDEEQYDEAREHLERVLMTSPDHANAHLLMGELKLKLKKLEEVTQLDIGPTRTQRVIVPGKPLRVKLEDKNLSVVGRNTNIEIRAWTKGGDEEFFNLYPFGDTKTKFQGTIPTVLQAAKRGDHTLQLLGDDVVHYDFSDAFKQRANIQTQNEITLSVATDATLQASATEILTREQLEELQLRIMLAKSKGREAYNRTRSTLMEKRQRNTVRPGNPFHVRVTDMDRSATAGTDNLEVSISTSSGDRITAYPLRENGGTTAQFDGTVSTAPSPPIAFASDSQEGLNPNFVISPKDYPAWTGALDNQAPKTYGVDLNDNVALKTLSVDTVAGRQPTEFLLQTAFNPDQWNTVGGFPEFNPWDGSLQVEVLPLPGGMSLDNRDRANLMRYINWGWRARNAKRAVKGLGDFHVKLSRSALERGGVSRLRYGTRFIARVRGAFYVERHRRHVFSLKRSQLPDGWDLTFSVDGKSPDDKDDGGKVAVTLEKGVHHATMIITGKVSNDKFDARLMVDTNEPPYLAPFDAALFNQEINPQIREAYSVPPAAVQKREDGNGFDIEFPDGTQARLFRLVMLKFDGDAPGFQQIRLTDREGTQVLPTKQDFAALHQNEILEIVPGDRITVEYVDPTVISRGSEKHAQFLEVTYNNAEVSAAFLEYVTDRHGERIPEYIQMIRFVTDEPILFLIQDPDADQTPKRDTVEFTAWTTEGKPQTYKALETQPHSGAFTGRVFPVQREPERNSEIKVLEGDQIFFSYLDRENTDPGIPWQREYAVPQVFWQDPEVRLYDSEIISLSHGPVPEKRKANERRAELDGEQSTMATTMPPQALTLKRPAFMDEGLQATAFVDGPKIVELTFPTITLSPESTATIYVQTDRGREKAARMAAPTNAPATDPRPRGEAPAGDAAPPPFDITVPGTIALTRTAESIAKYTVPGFVRTTVTGIPPYREDALIEGIYTFNIPTSLGDVPGESLVGKTPAPDRRTRDDEEQTTTTLKISGRDTIHVGFKYTDPQGQEQWITGSFQLRSRAGFQIYDRRYQNVVGGMYVGETLYFEVIDKAMDVTSERDQVTIKLATKAGESVELPLKETFSHTGVFRGLLTPVFAGKEQQETATEDGEFGLPDLPVVYGDTITATYGDEAAAVERTIEVYKGADGELLIFTKRFEDDDIAVQTQFTIAESYFELAKKHRNLGQEELAKREILQGKRLLEEAIRDFPESDVRAQADYLLANLALEFGNDADAPQRKMDFYNEAITRFTDIVASSPDSTYAPKSQYKKALTYEKMGKLDKACEEYVKLSYRYPDNELVAETISRLGRYFWTKGKSLNDQAKQIEDEVKRYKVQQQARNMYRTSAEVFGRLASRFPTHSLAGKTTVLSGQAYIQAGQSAKAVEVLEEAIKTYDGDKTLVPQAMYWCADAYMRAEAGNLPPGKEPIIEAYRMFKNLTWDYPATDWAKYARGRLTTEVMVKAAERSEGD